jgi:hypothetical protein
MKKEVSDKVVVVLLVIAVVVAVLGAYFVYDYSNEYSVDDGRQVTHDYASGHVILNVIEKQHMVGGGVNENI